MNVQPRPPQIHSQLDTCSSQALQWASPLVVHLLVAAPSRAQPPPSAESLQRFLRLQEHLETLANYLLFCKICAGLLFVVAVIRFITMVPAIPERMQGLRKLLAHLNAAKMQTACTLLSLFTTFLLFCFVGMLPSLPARPPGG